MRTRNVLVALALVQSGMSSAPAFARAGFSNPTSITAPPSPTLELPVAPPEAPRALKGKVPKTRADVVKVQLFEEPKSFTNRFSSVCNQMLAFPPTPDYGARSDAYEVATDLAVPRQQVSRLIERGPSESFVARLLGKFKSLLGRAEPDLREVHLDIPDIGAPNIDLETKRILEQVAERIAVLESDTYTKPNSHYLMRHSLHARKPIRVYIKRMLKGANERDAALVAAQNQNVVVAPDVAPAVIPAVDLVPPAEGTPEPKVYVDGQFNFPFNVDWANVKTWSKQLGGAAAMGLGTVFMIQSDPKWLLGTMVGVGAGVAFMSAPLRDQLGQFKGWIRSVLDRRRQGLIETYAQTLAQRLERTRVQAAVLQQIVDRLEGTAESNALTYYSYVAEAEVPFARTQPVVPIGVPPRPTPGARTKLVRVEHILYTNLNSHRFLTYVTDLSEPIGPFTEVSLVHK